MSSQVSVSKNGPAQTLHIQDTNFKIDVDLVPAIELPSTVQPPSPIRWFPKMAAPWVVVPKPVTEDNTVWRLSFPVQEKELMNGLRHLKYINRLLKKFRDTNKMNIPSYYIKTLFLWEAHEQSEKDNKDFWKKRPSYLFVYMLVKLHEALEKETLRFFWHEKMNLFQTLSHINLINMEGQVKRIIGKINRLMGENDAEKIKLFLCELFHVDGMELASPNMNAVELNNTENDVGIKKKSNGGGKSCISKIDTNLHKCSEVPIECKVPTDEKLDAAKNSDEIADRLSNGKTIIPSSSGSNCVHCGSKDEFDLLGEEVAMRVRKLPTKYVRHLMQFKIQELLFKAATGEYDKLDNSAVKDEVISIVSSTSASASTP